MPIKYKVGIISKLKSAGYSAYRIRKDKLFGEGTVQKFRNGEAVSWVHFARLSTRRHIWNMSPIKKVKVNSVGASISKHAKDIIQKYTSGLFKDATLEFYGIKTARIKELINVELPTVEVAGSSSDVIFLLEDDTYLHFEFQTTYNKSDLLRFAGYDLRLFERDRRFINTVVIYTADVKEAPTGLNIGSLAYAPDKVMMNDYDGDSIFEELSEKIHARHELTDADMLNLIFLPLMSNTTPKVELAIKSIELAQTITDVTKKNSCVAAAFAFANKYLNEAEEEKILEVLKMTDLATMLVEDAISEREIEIAKKLLKRGISIMAISEDTGLDESTIKRIQSELDNE